MICSVSYSHFIFNSPCEILYNHNGGFTFGGQRQKSNKLTCQHLQIKVRYPLVVRTIRKFQISYDSFAHLQFFICMVLYLA